MFCIYAFICILFSITTISASDNQSDITLNQDSISNEKLVVTTNKSYDDFYNDIKNCTDSFDIQNNYKYGESDALMELEFNQTNLVINGNNHVIDGSNNARGFKDDSVITANKDISVDYAGGSYFSVNVVTSDGRPVGSGAIVKFTINGKTTAVKTDTNGIAKIKITDVPKKYTIKTTYNAKTYTNKVTVKQVLTTTKVTVKKTAKSFALKAKLKINGKLIKGKTITSNSTAKPTKQKQTPKELHKKPLIKMLLKSLKKAKTTLLK